MYKAANMRRYTRIYVQYKLRLPTQPKDKRMWHKFSLDYITFKISMWVVMQPLCVLPGIVQYLTSPLQWPLSPSQSALSPSQSPLSPSQSPLSQTSRTQSQSAFAF